MPLVKNKYKPLHLIKPIANLLFDTSKKWRTRVAYGGRGSGKSWGFADALIEISLHAKKRILCTREIQNSIKDSVHKLLCDRIDALGYSGYFTITDNEIRNKVGSTFIFRGLKSNIAEIKSMEGIDYCWVAEAQPVSKESWEILCPTIRKEGSEIWIEFNPKWEDDETYKHWVINAPENCIVAKVNYLDNSMFPEVLRVEMEQDKVRDPVLYECKWLGKPVGIGSKVWTAFNKGIHVRELPWDVVAKQGNCFMAIDPHSHYYPFCLWMAIVPKNSRGNWPEDFYRYFYNEWPMFDDLNGYYHDCRKSIQFTGSLKDIATAIYNKDGSGQYGIKICKRFIDTRYAKGSGSWNWSSATTGIIDLFSKPENGGLLFDLPAEKAIDAQRQALHSDMLYNKLQAVNQFNEPNFLIAPWCRNTIASFENHRLIEGTETEDDKYKEPSDCARINYAGVTNWKFKDAEKKIRTQQSISYSMSNSSDGWMER